ncbi:MAG: hypothetical protein FJ276_26750, partial [Planctomycetes bacterium]|nr:hypothetical protein [Planctomycetota bacterium]
DLFAMPKAMNAGLFARRMSITPGQYPAFADCSVGSQPDPLTMRHVTRRYKLPPTAEERQLSAPTRWLDELGVFSFALAAQPDGAETYEPGLRDWFDDAQILICRGVKTGRGLPFGVALKGGHNAEHHNHNDVGSYVVCVGKSMPLVDPGAEVYTRRTFSGERYVSGVLNSFGHPVPRVAGQLQRTGRAAAAKVLAIDLTDDTDTVTFDLAAPYPVKSLKSLKRTFTFSRVSGGLTVKDEVAFDGPESFGTAIVTQGGWERIAENRLRVGSGDEAVIVDIDAGAHPMTITPTAIEEDIRGGLKPVRIGIDLKEPVREATICVRVSPAK